MAALGEFFSQDISFRLLDLGSGFIKYGTVSLVQILCKYMMFDTVNDIEFLSEFVTAGRSKVILLLIKELCIHQVGCTFNSRDFILLLVLVHFQQCCISCLGLVSLKSIGYLFIRTQERGVDGFIDIQEFSVIILIDQIFINIETHSF